MNKEEIHVDIEKQYVFGHEGEIMALPIIKKHFGFNDDEYKHIYTKRYSAVDIKFHSTVSNQKFHFEIKRRNLDLDSHNTTMIDLLKITKLLQKVQQGQLTKAYAVFMFSGEKSNDDIYFYEITMHTIFNTYGVGFENKPNGRGGFCASLIVPTYLLTKI